jgi:D-alanyl-D-alanine carboxypeptidase
MRHPTTPRLLNLGSGLEALPAALARPRGNAHARALAGAEWLLRRKADGRFLAAVMPSGKLRILHADARGLRHPMAGRAPDARAQDDQLAALHAHFDIPADYAERTGLERVYEPAWLAFAGVDRYRRPLWLAPGAARAWARMCAAAADDGIALEAISGYRGLAYQAGIVARKRARGLGIAQILAVNAAPGYSEHHDGRALDIGTPGEPAAEESFEHTPAFAWLQSQAGRFGFRMSYPRDNPHGVVYEPWHWRWHPAPAAARA